MIEKKEALDKCEARPVAGYESMYSVTAGGSVWSHKTSKFLGIRQRPDGYCVTDIRDGAQVKKTVYIHHLVADAYLDKTDESLEINHIDGNKANNNIGNLEFVTRSQNIQHSYDIGVRKVHQNTISALKESRKKKRIVPESIVRLIRQKYGDGYSLNAMAKELGFSLGSVSKIAYRQSYKEVI